MWMDRREPTSSRSGFALEATLMLLILLTVLISAGPRGHDDGAAEPGVDYRGARATYAAESGADHVMSQLEGDIQDGSISDAELAALTPPVIGGFNLTVSGARVGAPVPKTIASGPYTGLFGLNQQIDITVHAEIRERIAPTRSSRSTRSRSRSSSSACSTRETSRSTTARR